MPIIKNDSMKFIMLICSFSSLVINPIVPNTETFIKPKQAPVTINKSFTAINVFTNGMVKHASVINASDNNIDFLYPILAMKEATINEATAILRSLQGSSTEADNSST